MVNGTPVRVDRSINDLILVDDALNESMLNTSIQKEDVTEIYTNKPEEIIEINQNIDEKDETRNDEIRNNINENDEIRNDVNECDETGGIRQDLSDETGGIRQDLRRSKRDRKQRVNISPDEIGECDDEKDEDYN